MTWAKKVLAPIALATGLGFTAMAFAETRGGFDDEQDPQPEQKKGFDKKGFDRKAPFGGFDKKADPKADPQPEPRRQVPQPPRTDRGERNDRNDGGLDAWVQTLAGKITDPHDLIRDSARGALVGVGRAAIPALQKLADGDDAAKSLAAKRVIAAIEQSAPRPEDGRRNAFGPGGPAGQGWGAPGGRTGFFPNEPGAVPPGGGRPVGPGAPGSQPPGGGRPGAGPGPGPGGPGSGPTPPPGRPGGRGPGEGGETPPVRPM